MSSSPACECSAAPHSSSLDPSETNAQLLAIQTRSQYLAHQRTKKARARVVHALSQDAHESSQRRAKKLAECCANPVLYVAKDGLPCVSLQRCRDRACPLCSAIRGSQAAEKVEAIARRMNSPRLVTLTLASSEDPLGTQIDRLFNSFRELRRRKFWKERVISGVFTLEITFNAQRGTWHPHLHILTDGFYMPQNLLREEWHDVTTDSFIVDVRAVRDRKQAARYIAAYVAKPLDAHGWTDDTLCTFLRECKGRRFIGTIGKAHSTKVDGNDTEKPAPIESQICAAAELRLLADAGDDDARRAVSILSSHSWSFATALHIPWLPDAPDHCEPSEAELREAVLLARAAVRRFNGWQTDSRPSSNLSVSPQLFSGPVYVTSL